MIPAELECPICHADVPLNGDESPGEEIFCTYCSAPLSLKKGDEDELELEDDF